jgi:hypothetical protein
VSSGEREGAEDEAKFIDQSQPLLEQEEVGSLCLKRKGDVGPKGVLNTSARVFGAIVT